MPVESGKRYVFINKRSGTALDLDTGDNRTVQGWERHGGPNQQWEATSQGSNWQFTNVQQGNHLRREGNSDGNRVIGTPGVFSWSLELQHGTGENVYRIVSPSSSVCVDLANGSGDNGTPVQVWTSMFGNFNQLSKFRLRSNQSSLLKCQLPRNM